MSAFGDFTNVDKIVKDLEEIELKYSPLNDCTQKTDSRTGDLRQNLNVLSKELDSLGLPTPNLQNSILGILEQVVQCSRTLVHIHRNAVSQIRDKNIENRNKDTKKNELFAKIDEYKLNLDKCQESYAALQNKNHKLNKEIKDLHKREISYKEEIERIKRYYSSKQEELERSIRKLKSENGRLQEMLGTNITTDNSTNEVALKLLKKYRTNETIYKSTIRKLQENNKELLEEVLNLKEEIVLSHDKK